MLLVEESELIGDVLAETLEREVDVTVIGVTRDCEAAVAVAQATYPDVVVLDLDLDPESLSAGVARIRRVAPRARFVVFTARGRRSGNGVGIAIGASAYLERSCSREDFLGALHAAHGGSTRVQAKGAARVLRGPLPAEASCEANLTRREREILERLVNGMPNKEIAATLGVADQTVKTHVKNLFRKLGVSDRTTAAVLALRRKWIS